MSGLHITLMRLLLILLTTSTLSAQFLPTHENLGINEQFTDWWDTAINETGGYSNTNYEEFRAYVLSNPPPSYQNRFDNLVISESIEPDDLSTNPVANQNLTPSLINTANDIQHELEENDGSIDVIQDDFIVDDTTVEDQPTGSGGDSDNDVPAIQAVEGAVERVYSKVEEARQEIFDLRGKHDDNGTLKDTQLSDIYYAIVGGRLPEDQQGDSLLALNSKIQDVSVDASGELNSIEEKVDDNFFNLPDESTSVASARISMDGVMNGASFDLFDMASDIPGLDFLPPLSEIATWVKACIGILCLILYWRAILDLTQASIRDVMMMQESNPVTNYGGAVGAVVNLPVKLAKVALFMPFLLTFSASLVLMLETSMTMSGGGFLSGLGMDPLFNKVTGASGNSGTGGWVVLTWDIFCMFVPYITIGYMFLTYWVNKFGIYLIMFMYNRSTRILT